MRRSSAGMWPLAVLAAAAACGGSGSAARPSGNETVTFMGSTRSVGATGCNADSHQVNAGQGSASVTLVQTTPSVALLVQLCAPSVTDHSRDCTINRQRIDVGQTLSGPVTGGATQVLVLNTLSCGGGAPPEPTPITYTVSVLFPR